MPNWDVLIATKACNTAGAPKNDNKLNYTQYTVGKQHVEVFSANRKETRQ